MEMIITVKNNSFKECDTLVFDRYLLMLWRRRWR